MAKRRPAGVSPTVYKPRISRFTKVSIVSPLNLSVKKCKKHKDYTFTKFSRGPASRRLILGGDAKSDLALANRCARQAGFRDRAACAAPAPPGLSLYGHFRYRVIEWRCQGQTAVHFPRSVTTLLATPPRQERPKHFQLSHGPRVGLEPRVYTGGAMPVSGEQSIRGFFVCLQLLLLQQILAPPRKSPGDVFRSFLLNYGCYFRTLPCPRSACAGRPTQGAKISPGRLIRIMQRADAHFALMCWSSREIHFKRNPIIRQSRSGSMAGKRTIATV